MEYSSYIFNKNANKDEIEKVEINGEEYPIEKLSEKYKFPIGETKIRFYPKENEFSENPVPVNEPISPAQININKVNIKGGDIRWMNGKWLTVGDIENNFYTFNGIPEGKTTLKYEGEDGEPLSNFTDFNCSNSLIRQNICPFNGKYIGVYPKNNDNLKVSINDKLLKRDFGKRRYRFGLLSDVHHSVDDRAKGKEDLRNALSFFDKKEEVKFVCITGDLTVADWPGEFKDLDSFKENIDSYSTHTPVFISRGNHDIGCLSSLTPEEIKRRWKYYSFPTKNIDEYDIQFQHENDIDDTENFYFIKNNDVFIFLSLIDNGGNGWRIDDLYWVWNILNKYRNNRCFLFTHLFFENEAGDAHCGGAYYSYWRWLFDTETYKIFYRLNKYYKNCIFFSGHSHISWRMQQYPCYNANISNSNGESAWKVHIPSGAYPRVPNSSSTGYSDKYNASEGGVVDVYDDYVDIRGIIFKTEEDDDYVNKYDALSHYRIPIANKCFITLESKDWEEFIN